MSAKGKKEMKTKSAKSSAPAVENVSDVSTTEELKSYLLHVRDKLHDDAAPAVFGISAMRHVLNLPQIYTLLDKENKEIARDIWLKLKQCGVQLRNPPLLFSADEEDITVTL